MEIPAKVSPETPRGGENRGFEKPQTPLTPISGGKNSEPPGDTYIEGAPLPQERKGL